MFDPYRYLRHVNSRVDITPLEKVIAGALAITFRNGKTGRCDPSYETIAEATGCGRRSTMRAIQQLEKAGCLAIMRRPRPHSNSFRLLGSDRADTAPSPSGSDRADTRVVTPRSTSGDRVDTQTSKNPRATARGDEDGAKASAARRAPDRRARADAVDGVGGFDALAKMWPRSEAIAKAKSLYRKAVEGGEDGDKIAADARVFLDACEVDGREAEFIPFLANWLDQGRPAAPTPKPKLKPSNARARGGNGAADSRNAAEIARGYSHFLKDAG